MAGEEVCMYIRGHLRPLSASSSRLSTVINQSYDLSLTYIFFSSHEVSISVLLLSLSHPVANSLLLTTFYHETY